MSTRSGYIFEYSHFLGRTDDGIKKLLLYRHQDGYPEAVVPLILEHWTEARLRHTRFPPPNAMYPQLSHAQVIAGLFLADVEAEFRLISDSEVFEEMDMEYFYSFKQTARGEDTLTASIRRAGRSRKQFTGGVHKLTEYWEKM